MKFLSPKIKIFMLVFIVLGATLAVVVHFTDICRLEAVVLDGREIENWEKKYHLDSQASVFKQPLDSVAKMLLAKKNIARVEIDYNLPDKLAITINNFKLTAFVVDRYSGLLYGLDEQARVVLLDRKVVNWELPCLTNVKIKKLFTECDDFRVNLIVPQLEELRDQHLDLYRLVNEIDFENSHFLMVSISGLPFRLKVRAENFLERFNVFIRFMENYEVHLDSTKVVDLRFDDMIITAGEET